MKNGLDYSNLIFEQLKAARPTLSKLQSLSVKGQIFGFKDYQRCFIACEMLTWSFNQIEAFAAIPGDAQLNWENDEVQKMLDNLDKIDPEKIRINFKDQSKELVTFAKAAYESAL